MMVNQEEKREVLKRAFGEYLERAMDAGDETHGQVHKFLNRNYYMAQIIDALAEQVIVWEIEIIHMPPSNGFDALTAVETDEQTIYFDGLHGRPGKATAIIVPDPGEL